ncbi:MAG: hypothetical protein GW938_04765 [Leptospira sp.]|nr:hypothetical protein [Leptospira sp.]NCS95169.1 hypothetical protein [Leptospira sp.]
MNKNNCYIIFFLISLSFNCLKTETSCKKQAKKDLLEGCQNQIISEIIETPNDEISEIINRRKVRDICLISLAFYVDEKEYCNQPFIFWQNEL